MDASIHASNCHFFQPNKQLDFSLQIFVTQRIQYIVGVNLNLQNDGALHTTKDDSYSEAQVQHQVTPDCDGPDKAKHLLMAPM